MRPVAGADMDELIERFATDIRRIARAHGATRVRLFGSRAGDGATLQRDVDLLVDLEPGRDLLDLVAIKHDLETLLGWQVDVLEAEGLSPSLKARILRDSRQGRCPPSPAELT